MKKIFTTLVAGLMISAQMMAVTTKDVCGRFDGDLNIDGTLFPSRSVYLLPGIAENTVTFVLPDFTFGKGKLGNIVLPNIPMDINGQLTLENATLYLDSISERATITVINGLEDGGFTYNSIVSTNEAMVLLSIAAPSLLEPIFVLFAGTAVRTNNYALNNGGFEGAWTNNEPQGWHSFGTADGDFADFVSDQTFQFAPSTEVRPGSEGTQSALVSSSILAGVKANGNCTNGRINAGSMTADKADSNYNYSDPASDGFNTTFNGRPDSLVFWAKYQPADLDLTNVENKARVNTVITTNARYQDPETGSYGDAKIGAATLNYSAVEGFGWQRLSVPFVYGEDSDAKTPAYILATFTTNYTPGGGSSYTIGTITKTPVLDSVYVDDVELVYNKELSNFTISGEALTFNQHIATVESNYCDSCVKYGANGNGLTAQPLIAFDATHKCIHIYVIADDYAQSGAYNIYRVDFADSNTSDLDPIVDPSGLEDILLNTKVEKVLINGQVLIRRDNALYNIMGVRVL